jgi:putative aldouronate transport system substrate-binding protein
MKLKKATSILCLIVIFMVILSACGGNPQQSSGTSATTQQQNQPSAASEKQEAVAASYDKHVKFSYASIVQFGDLTKDELYKYLSQKFNFEIEPILLTWDNWQDKVRIFFTSGDMPDVVMTDIRDYSTWRKYSEMGIFKALPDDLSQFPNIKQKIETSKYFKDYAIDGKFYFYPRWQDFYKDEPYSHACISYRRDWAEKAGLKHDASMTLNPEEFIDFAKNIVKGAENSNGEITPFGAVGWGVPSSVIGVFSPYYSSFVKMNGKYVWGPTLPETLEGIKYFKRLVDEGVFWKDYIIAKNDDSRKLFLTGKLAMWYQGLYVIDFTDFKNNNPELDPYKVIGTIYLTDPEGKVTRSYTNEWWSESCFSVKMDDETFNRVLALTEWGLTDEGLKSSFGGVPGVDWENGPNGELVLMYEKDANGQPVKSYISTANGWRFFATCGGRKTELIDPTIPDAYKELFKTTTDLFYTQPFKTKDLDVDYQFYSAPNKDKYGSYSTEIDEQIKILATTSKDIETDWNNWVKSMEPKVQKVLDEINNMK